MSQRFLRYTISPRILILPAGRYPTGYYAAGGSEQCGLYGENASIAFLIRNPRGRRGWRGGGGGSNETVVIITGASAGEERKRGGYIVLVNVSPRTDLTWLAIIK